MPQLTPDAQAKSKKEAAAFIARKKNKHGISVRHPRLMAVLWVWRRSLRRVKCLRMKCHNVRATSSQTSPPPEPPKSVCTETHKRCREEALPTHSQLVNAGCQICGFSLYCSLTALLKVGEQRVLGGLCEVWLNRLCSTASSERPELRGFQNWVIDEELLQ